MFIFVRNSMLAYRRVFASRCRLSGDWHVWFGYLWSRPMHSCRERAQVKAGAYNDDWAEARLLWWLE